MSINIHRDARLLGYRREKDLQADLHRVYPFINFRIGFKEIFDLYSSKVLIDHVGVSRGRLIIDKKQCCHRHIEEANMLGCIGYISFLHEGAYYFLPIESKYARYHKRPMVTERLLQSCVIDPVCLGNSSQSIISQRYVNELKMVAMYERQQNTTNYASIKPSKSPQLEQEERLARIYALAAFNDRKHMI